VKAGEGEEGRAYVVMRVPAGFVSGEGRERREDLPPMASIRAVLMVQTVWSGLEKAGGDEDEIKATPARSLDLHFAQIWTLLVNSSSFPSFPFLPPPPLPPSPASQQCQP
jgi:hypothetical protein